MRSHAWSCAPAALALLCLLGTVPVDAAMVQKMNLENLCDAAGTIARVQVENVTPGNLAVPGGEIPARVYTLRVVEGFKGVPATDSGTFEVIMLDATRIPQAKSASGLEHVAVLPDLPILEPGEEVLLLSTQAGGSGLSTTVGLSQGLFRIEPTDSGVERVANGLDNVGLLDGMAVAKAVDLNALSYDRLAGLIRNAVGESR